MSAAQIPPPDASSLWIDAALSGALGLGAALARHLLSIERHSWGCLLRRLIVASFTATLVGLGVRDLIDSEGLRFASAGAIAFAAPETLDYFLAWLRKKGERVVDEA
jgi:hypothetical protein